MAWESSIFHYLVGNALSLYWARMGTTSWGFWLVPSVGGLIGWLRSEDRRSLKALLHAIFDGLAAVVIVFVLVFGYEVSLAWSTFCHPQMDCVPASPSYPPKIILKETPRPPKKILSNIQTIRYRGVETIKIDKSGAASVLLLFDAMGDQTIRVDGSSYSAAVSPVPATPEEELQKQEMFWSDFESYERKKRTKFITSVVPNKTGIVTIPLGPNISNLMSNLREQGGVIYVAVRVRNPEGRVIEQTCVGIDPTTAYSHLCNGHNIP